MLDGSLRMLGRRLADAGPDLIRVTLRERKCKRAGGGVGDAVQTRERDDLVRRRGGLERRE